MAAEPGPPATAAQSGWRGTRRDRGCDARSARKSRGELSKIAAADAAFAAKYKVADEHCFTGFNAYREGDGRRRQLVILATPAVTARRPGGDNRGGADASKAGSGRCGRHPLGARDLSGEKKGVSASAPDAAADIRPEIWRRSSGSRQGDRQRHERPGVLEPGRALEQRRQPE